MKILRGITSNAAQAQTAPFPQGGARFFFELRGGDVLHPLGAGDWFAPPYFSRWVRFFCPWPVLPFLSWKIGRYGGYIGAKAYGADSDAYRAWMPAGDVYPGSVALMASIRLFARLD